MKIVLENHDLKRKMARVDYLHQKAMTDLATIREALEVKEIQKCNLLGEILQKELGCICTPPVTII